MYIRSVKTRPKYLQPCFTNTGLGGNCGEMQAKKSRRGHCLENKNVFHKSFELTKMKRLCIKWAAPQSTLPRATGKCHMWQSPTVMAAGCVQPWCALEQDVLLPGIADLVTPALPSACHGCSCPGRVSLDVGAVLALPLPVPTQVVAPRSPRGGGLGYVHPKSEPL